MADIPVGTTVTVAADIVVNGVLTFGRGEQVVVQQVAPNVQQPEYKYTVMSARTGTWYTLRDADLVVPLAAQAQPPQPVQAPPPAAPVQPPAGVGAGYPQQPQFQPPQRPQPKKGGTALKGCLIAVGIVAVIGILVVVILFTVVGVGVHHVATESGKATKNGTVFSTPNGTITTTTPTEAQVGVPVYPGAKSEGGISLNSPDQTQGIAAVTLYSNDPPEKVVAWYRQQLSGKPEYSELLGASNQLMATFRPDSTTTKMVTVGPNTSGDGKGLTKIAITTSKDTSSP